MRASRAGLAVLAGACLLLTGCSGLQKQDVEQTATTFENPSGDPGERCALLAPSTLASLEKDASAPCTDALQDLGLDGGAVVAVEVWGGGAQVRLRGDTVFLTQTSSGWRVTAAGCRSQGEAPYDCEVTGS